MLKTTKNIVEMYKKQAKDIIKSNKAKEKAMKSRVKNTRQAIKQRVEKKFRLWYRLSQADENGNVKCYTCGRTHNYKKVDAGHYIHRKLGLDERNYKIQCGYCNQHLSGNMAVYTQNLIRDYGIKWVEKLEKDAEEYIRYEVSYMLEVEKELNKKIKDLKDIIEPY